MKTPKPLLFTKSRFRIALECPTKLYYLDLKDEQGNLIYKNRMSDDPFLQTLADGGHMVGEMAKFVYHPSPQQPDITVHERGYDASIAETNQRLLNDIQAGIPRTVIAEAAIRHGEFFIRIDVLVADHREKTLTIVEVKAKSVGQETIESGFKNKNGYESKWLPYLYDVAFQTLVTEKAIVSMMDGRLSGYRVIPKLMLVDKNVPCDRSGLNQVVRIIHQPTEDVKMVTKVTPGTTRDSLGDLSFLREVDMMKIVNELRSSPVKGDHIPDGMGADLWTFMNWACNVQQSGERIFTQPDKRCAKCQFRAKSEDHQRSGIHECWAHAIGAGWLQGRVDDASNRDLPLSIDLWGGGAGNVSTAGKVLQAGHAFLRDVVESSFIPNKPSGPKNMEFTPHGRRVMQIDLVKNPESTYQIQKETLRDEMGRWDWPWHMIDFETSAPSIPFFEGMQPYQTVAFQFSHHRMDEDGTITHANQFISEDAGVDPTILFVRKLRRSLMPDGELRGTVFRYSNHENTVLRSIRRVIESDPSVSDGVELIEFIDRITRWKIDEKTYVEGPQNMVDLQAVVLRGYISQHAGGSNSIKYILPSILKDAPITAERYSKSGVYGSGLSMPSLNFNNPEGHVWLTLEAGGNPYKTLPSLFSAVTRNLDDLDELIIGFMDQDGEANIDEGGLAMAAYNLMQYTDLPERERKELCNGLLRYCELDTLAMCMLAQGLREISHE
jgi:hypothetical protein